MQHHTMEAAFLLFMVVTMGVGCTTPRISAEHITFRPDGKTTDTISRAEEVGFQLCGLADRHIAADREGASHNVGQAPVVAVGGFFATAYLATKNAAAAAVTATSTIVGDYMQKKP